LPVVWAAVAVAAVLVLARGDSESAVLLAAPFAAAAAWVDWRDGRIPNVFVLAVLSLGVSAAMTEVAGGSLGIVEFVGRVAAGLVLSGAALLFAVWLVRPRWVGGGDWKLLAACALVLAVIDPLAAGVAGVMALMVQPVVSLVRRRAFAPFGPAVALGYCAGVGWLALAGAG
jgi:Flp pilus assembly protein protease CpaA